MPLSWSSARSRSARIQPSSRPKQRWPRQGPRGGDGLRCRPVHSWTHALAGATPPHHAHSLMGASSSHHPGPWPMPGPIHPHGIGSPADPSKRRTPRVRAAIQGSAWIAPRKLLAMGASSPVHCQGSGASIRKSPTHKEGVMISARLGSGSPISALGTIPYQPEQHRGAPGPRAPRSLPGSLDD